MFEFKKTSRPDSAISQRVGLSPGKSTDELSYPLKTGTKRKFSNKNEDRTRSWKDVEVKDLKPTGSTTEISRKENKTFLEPSADDDGDGDDGGRKFKSIGAARNREISQPESEISGQELQIETSSATK